MTAKLFSNALGNIGTNYVNEAINYSAKKKKNIWINLIAIAACLCLTVLGTVHVLNRFEYFEESCSTSIGTVVEGVYYFEIPHDGIYSYEEDIGVKKILSTFWYDRWDVNEYGIYYNRGTKLYVLAHNSDKSVKLYSSASGSRIDYTVQPDGGVSASLIGKVDGKYQSIESFYMDGITGQIIERDTTETLYRIGNRTITHLATEDGCDLLENGVSILPENITVGYGADIFDDGGMFYIRSVDTDSWEMFIAFADGGNDTISIKGDPPFALIDRYALYVKNNTIWCIDIDSGETWELRSDSDKYEVYEFTLNGDKLYTCVPWSSEQTYWKINTDTAGKPITLSLIDKDIITP